MNNEFFPPTETELQEIIAKLQNQLEHSSFQDDWPKIAEDLKNRQNQLQQLIIQNNAL